MGRAGAPGEWEESEETMRARRDFSHIQRPVGVRDIRYRSKAEANYAAYLEWLRNLGQIESWDYEPMTFWFTPGSVGAAAHGLDGIRRGVTSYRPDFSVFGGRHVMVAGRKMTQRMREWHETKGFMDKRSEVALKRMALYYPEERIVVIDSKQMAALKRQVGGIVPGWIP